MRAKTVPLALLILALSLFAGRLLAESWAVPIFVGALLAAAAAVVLALAAFIIREAGRDELKRAQADRLKAYQAKPLERIQNAKRCASCWGPLVRPYVFSEGKFIGLTCCERRKEPKRRQFFDASEIRAARRAGLIGG